MTASVSASKADSNLRTQAKARERVKILEAASTLFLGGGLEALSVRAIATQAEVSTFAIYSHFKGKTEILDTLYCEGFQIVAKAMEVQSANRPERPVIQSNAGGPKTANTPPHSRALVLQACKNYMQLASEHSAHYRLIFGEAGKNHTPSESAKAESRSAFKRLVRLTSIILPVDACSDRQREVAIEIWAILHGFVCFQNHTVSEMIPDVDWTEAALRAVERHLDGL